MFVWCPFRILKGGGMFWTCVNDNIIDEKDQNGGKKQEDEERGGGMCTEWGEEEEFTCPIQRWAEERDKFFFTCVFKFEIGG